MSAPAPDKIGKWQPYWGLLGAGMKVELAFKPPLPNGYKPVLIAPPPLMMALAFTWDPEKATVMNMSPISIPVLVVISTPNVESVLGVAKHVADFVKRSLKPGGQ